MRGKCLVGFSLFIAFSVFYIAPSAVYGSSSLQSLISDLQQFSEFMDPEQREQSLQDLANLEEEFRRVSHDGVLTKFWERMLQLGSLLVKDLTCRSRLTNMEFIDTLRQNVQDPQQHEIGGLLYECLRAEVQLEKEATETLSLFYEELQSKYAGRERVMELRERYKPVRELLEALVSFTKSRDCELPLLFKLNLLGAAAANGDKTARGLLLGVEGKADKMRDSLVQHFLEVAQAAKKCEDSGLLFKGAVGLINAAAKIY